MTVRELIERLQACDPDADVKVDYGEPLNRIEQRKATGYERGMKRKAPWWDEQPIDPPENVVVLY